MLGRSGSSPVRCVSPVPGALEARHARRQRARGGNERPPRDASAFMRVTILGPSAPVVFHHGDNLRTPPQKGILL